MLVVQKYGGTSVGSPERIRAVADRVVRTRRAGHDVVVVVSAMGHATDELLELAAEVMGGEASVRHHPRELDMLLTAGERISMALLAMSIRERGEQAMSFTGSQAAIITDEAHTAARITEVRADRVRNALDEGCVVIVAGFQGVSRSREITTLGRGGSDTTAVALAAALGADRCEIYTDVRGVFTADPRKVPNARIIPELSHSEMLEMAAAGAQVMHGRAVAIAASKDVDLYIGSSFETGDEEPIGTRISNRPQRMEELVLTGITSAPAQAKLIMRKLPPGLRTATAFLVALAEADVSVDMVAEAEMGEDTRVQLELTVGEEQLDDALRICERIDKSLGGIGVAVQRSLTRISMIGTGMHRRPGVYARAFRTLLEEEIEVFAVSTSGISITVLVDSARADDALRALHDAFELELVRETALPQTPSTASA